jgi:hypothetical protein
MKTRDHSIISGVLGGAAYSMTGAPALAAGIFLSGVFIDVDHFYDYFRNVAVRIDIRDFFLKCENYEFRKLYIPLHSYEFLILLGLACLLRPSYALLGILVGSSVHLAGDLLLNRVYFLTYSFAYRLSVGFDSGLLFRPPYGKNKNT